MRAGCLGRLALCLSLLGWASPGIAGEYTCHINERTDAHTCYRRVTERAGVRYADLYMGGPKGVRPTGFQIATNCKSGVTHLKDRDGVSFAGGDGTETPAVRAITRWICEEKLPKK